MYSRKGSAVKKNYTRLTCEKKKANFTILGAAFGRGSDFGLIVDSKPYTSQHMHYSLQWLERAKIFRMQDQKHA